ncbi:MAG: pyrroline-5-carboxylate reductase [Oscillospiraceae bacterium]|nr:pyrroline-5-carboxylate reductase [Oscillospiraceae bacterium]
MNLFDAGFIGAGNMGGALLDAVKKSTGNIAVYDTDENKAKSKNAEFLPPDRLASSSHFVFLGVKPDVVKAVADKIASSIKGFTVIVSMAAGIDTKTLSELFGTKKIVRIMPNTPVAVGEGLTLYCTASGITDDEEEAFIDLMKYSGKTVKLDESKIDAGMAVSGCGPAYAYMFLEALADGAVKCGLTRDKAMLFASQTLLGSAKMLIESGKHPGLLKDEVCSPGGTTIEGVLALENGAFRGTVSNAVIAAYNKLKK